MVCNSSKIDYQIFEKLQKIADANEMPREKIVRLYMKRLLSDEQVEEMLSSICPKPPSITPETEVVTKTIPLCSP